MFSPKNDDDRSFELDENNPYVQELKNVFDSCDHENVASLDQSGVTNLCNKLHLSSHSEYILGQLLPYGTESRVTFPVFKRRFVQLLPEIVEFSTSNHVPQPVLAQENGVETDGHDDTSNDILSDFSEDLLHPVTTVINVNNMQQVDTAVKDLGLAENGYLGRYETRLLCQHCQNLSHLTSTEIGTIFAKLDKNSSGKISLDEFKNGFRAKIRPVLSPAVSLPNTPARLKRNSSQVMEITAHFFSAIDQENTGTINCEVLIEYWNGLGITNAKKILELLGYVDREEYGIKDLSGALEHELLESSLGSEVLMVAFLTYRAELDFLRTSLTDSRCNADHLRRQLETTTRRQTVLIEEMDQNHHSLERQNDEKIRELESRHRLQTNQMEERFRSEKDYFSTQLAQLEEQLKKAKQAETATRNRLNHMERDTIRLRRENQELSQTVKEMESLNREMRLELQRATVLAKKTMTVSNMSQGTSENQWKHRAELLALQNKRLKDRLDEMPVHSRVTGTRRQNSTLSASHLKHTTAFKRELQKLHKRRKLVMTGSMSEFESDPEPIIFRPRTKRPLLRKQRRARSDRRVKRQLVVTGENSQSTSSEMEPEQKSSVAEEIILGRSLGGVQLKRMLHRRMDEERKQLEHQLKLEIADAELAFQSEKQNLLSRMENEKSKLRDQYEQEMTLMAETAKRQKEEALSIQAKDLTEKYEHEKRDMEIKFASETNAMERKFAEDKMQMMSRLQEDFEVELRRARDGSNSSGTYSQESAQIDELNKKIKVLESSLDGQRNGYEAKLKSVKSDYERRLDEMIERAESGDDWFTAEDLPKPLRKHFYALLDEFRDRERKKFAQEREDMLQGLQKERSQIAQTLDAEKDFLVRQHADQITQLHSNYNSQISDAQEKLDQSFRDQDCLKTECTRLAETKTRLDDSLLELASLREECASLKTPRPNATRHVQTDEPCCSHSAVQTDQSSFNFDISRQRCARCQMIVGKMLDLEDLIQNDISVESGIEEMASSADSLDTNLEPLLLKKENQKLRYKLKAARERLLDLRLCLALSNSQEIRLHYTENTDEIMWSPEAKVNALREDESVESSLAKELERLREENYLLEARISETNSLLQDTVVKYQAQLRETTRLGDLIQSLWRTKNII